MFVDFNCTS